MKKIVSIIIITTMLMLSLSGCNSRSSPQGDDMGENDSALLNIYRILHQWFPRMGTRYDPHHSLETEVMGSLMERLIPALENNDRDALKGLFSESALAEARNIEENIDLIMEYFQGVTTELVSGGASRHRATDTTRMQIGGSYTVATTKNVYRLIFTYVYADDRNPENDGLHELGLVIYEDFLNFGWAAGVSVAQSQDSPYHGLLDEVMERMIAALDNNDRDALKEMFSERALAEAQDIEEDIDLIMESYQGVMAEQLRTGSTRNGAIGNDILDMSGAYIVTTTQNVYRLGFTYFFINDRNPANVGLSSIRLITEEEFSDFRWAAGIRVPALQEGSYHDHLDEVMDRLIAALDNQDKDALMAMFSERALEGEQNIETGIDLIIELYQGIMTEQVRTGWMRSGAIGIGLLELTGAYEITTTQNVYRFNFTYVHDNERYPTSVGLRSIRLITDEDFRDFGWAAGIRVPELQTE